MGHHQITKKDSNDGIRQKHAASAEQQTWRAAKATGDNFNKEGEVLFQNSKL